MAENKTLNITWHDHLENLCGLFQDLYENKKLVDVTLYCSEGSLKAHKIVLSACSPYFARIFQENNMKHPIIILKGVALREMQKLLEFMYKGSIDVLEEELSSIIQVGSYLEVKGMDVKNIPNNFTNSSKRPLTNDIHVSAKKLKEDKEITKNKNAESLKGEEEQQDKSYFSTNNTETDNSTDLTKTASHINTDTSTSSRRETRYKGKKRVDVFHLSSPRLKVKSTATLLKDTRKSTEEKYAACSSENDSVSKIVIKDVCTMDDAVADCKNFQNDTESTGAEERNSDNEKSMYCPPAPDVMLHETDTEINEDFEAPETNEEENSESSLLLKKCNSENDLLRAQEPRPYHCDFCTSCFTRSSHLTRHRRTHTGEKPYSCEECGKMFARKDKLKLHEKSHKSYNKYASMLEETHDMKKPNPSAITVKKARGRPRKFPLVVDTTPKEKRPRGRPRKYVNPLAAEPVENYDITNLPYGDFTYLTSMPLEQGYENFTMDPNVPDEESKNATAALLNSVRQIGECTIQTVTK